MKTINATPLAPEEMPAKSQLFFTALALSALMVSAVGGGAAFMIYHQFASLPASTQVQGEHAEHLATVPLALPVAAEASDRSDYRQVDNTVLPPAEVRRVIAAWRSNPVISNVPAPLPKTVEVASEETTNRPPLADPDSHYIVSASTGQVVGIDGSAGAATEVRRAVAVQTLAPEVRMASTVQVRAALPVAPSDEAAVDQQDNRYTSDAQYVPVRRAQPVAINRNFNAANYLASEDERPILRGQAVINPTSREADYRHDFRLPDFSNR